MARMVAAMTHLFGEMEDPPVVGEYDFARLQLTAEQRWLILGRIDTCRRAENLMTLNTENPDVVKTVLMDAFGRR